MFKRIKKKRNNINHIASITIFILGFIIAAYVGGKVLFLDGFVNVVNLLKASNYSGLELGKNILRILVVYPICGIINAIFIFIAVTVNEILDK
ncbi:hypothetical protein IR152_10660 [Clostridioides sp. ES-S-0108-01]|uniref:hypothetical protein n=1 Tax=Clostridioides sp. ES-S-0108-01 TaxID=2770773 RepID=UPI001D0C0AAE|nr:hypothetical protein [Clostridioides sp. ES-S-0108-01]